MKKIVLILICALAMLASGAVHSQVVNTNNSYGVTYNLVSATGYLSDTSIDAVTKYLIMPAKVGGYYKTCEFNLFTTNISGTTAITATLQHSTDSLHWFSFSTDSTHSIAGTDSRGWRWSDWGDQIVRIKIVQTGTSHTRLQGSLILRKPIEISQ